MIQELKNTLVRLIVHLNKTLSPKIQNFKKTLTLSKLFLLYTFEIGAKNEKKKIINKSNQKKNLKTY